MPRKGGRRGVWSSCPKTCGAERSAKFESLLRQGRWSFVNTRGLDTLNILAALLPRGARGLEWGDHGASVHWDALEDGVLSTTEKATVTVARGLSVLERIDGGLPGDGHVADAVSCAIESLRGTSGATAG